MSHFGVVGLQLILENKNNLETIEQEIRKVRSLFPWADMVVGSELNLLGSNTDNACELPGEVEKRLCQIAQENALWLMPGTLFEKSGSKVYNTALVINPDGEVVTRYRKMFPFQPYEKGVTEGDQWAVFDIPDVGRFGVSICYDMWFPETTRTLAWMGAEVIIHPTLTGTIDRNVELAIARSNAAINQCYFVDINGAGNLGTGQSVIIGPGGEVIHQAGRSREIIAVELDLNHVRHCRERGWQGLGQPLKSFRDNQVEFPPYQPSALSPALNDLGPLAMPDASSSQVG
ncbi:carbon-nitrogen hydrolase family protein [bacterium SCSIO 12696]|nr:carbon-nitrogen hydrolase family protein [bacterium SCSIO 12696]